MSKTRIRAEEAFIVTVGVPSARRQSMCNLALRVLRNYGFECGPTSEESLITLGRQAALTKQLAENDPPTTTERNDTDV
jgi:hypothetical protein